MNSVIATTKSSIYLAIKHIFPEVPINAGTFAPLHIIEPKGTFLYAEYPRPVSGCAAEVSQRIAESVFSALVKAIPGELFAAPAGTSGNFALGGYDPEAPIEVIEQRYPVLIDEYALHEGSGGAGEARGGFGVRYSVTLQGGTARASFVMDHGRTGPQGMLGGGDGGVNKVVVHRQGETYIPPHLSKDQGILVEAGDRVVVSTPGGGGFGDPLAREPALVAADVRKGYYRPEDVAALFGVILDADTLEVDEPATAALRARAQAAE
jgi:N-methylhydantoinase B